MYDIALTVAACLRAQTAVDVAWIADAPDFPDRDAAQAVALTPGGGRVGSLLGGALDGQLVSAAGGAGRLLDLHVGQFEAELAELAHGGDVRCLLVPATGLPGELWDRLREREPVCLVTRLDGDRVIGTSLRAVADAPDPAVRLAERGASATAVTADAVVTMLFPVPRLVIVGGGPIAEALSRAAALLGWHTDIAGEPGRATGLIAGLAPLDKVVVAAHDDDLGGPALAAALDTEVGYIAALGTPRKHEQRAQWLAYRGITDLARIHTPAGLDIGARTPAEVAVSILAEAIAAAREAVSAEAVAAGAQAAGAGAKKPSRVS